MRILRSILVALSLAGCAVDVTPEPVDEAAQALLELGEVCNPDADPARCCSGTCEKDANLPGVGRCIENKWQCGCATEPPCP